MKKLFVLMLIAYSGFALAGKENRVRLLNTVFNEDIVPGTDNAINIGDGSGSKFATINSYNANFANNDIHIGNDMFGISAIYSPFYYNMAGTRALQLDNTTGPYPDVYLLSTDGANIQIASYSGTGVVMTPNHVRSMGPTPTSAPTANTGSTGSCTLTNATDLAGQVTIITDGSGIAAGNNCDITFQQAYVTAPICVITHANNPPSAVVPYVTATTTDLTINFGAAASATDEFVFNYHCFETTTPALRPAGPPMLKRHK